MSNYRKVFPKLFHDRNTNNLAGFKLIFKIPKFAEKNENKKNFFKVALIFFFFFNNVIYSLMLYNTTFINECR